MYKTWEELNDYEKSFFIEDKYKTENFTSIGQPSLTLPIIVERKPFKLIKANLWNE